MAEMPPEPTTPRHPPTPKHPTRRWDADVFAQLYDDTAAWSPASSPLETRASADPR